MTVDPRAALDRFIAALEAHYTAVVARGGDDDPRVDEAYDVLADAFEVYDDALGTVHGEATPFYLGEDEDDDTDDDVDEDDLDDGLDDDGLELDDDDEDDDEDVDDEDVDDEDEDEERS
ncbi:MAG: primosomal protein [Micrococcales bacterium]|nr:primosomal protein [Micrococcales bacterium]MCL2666268.1 primosomal protein [Micrococcales bacterium]